MRVLMIGAPGAGKGTQAVRIAAQFGLTHISSGDLFRDHVTRDTAIGRAAKAYLARGDLVPDAVVMDMLYKPVTQASKGAGYILDGFPRTVAQAAAAYSVAKDLGVAVQIAVHLDVPVEELKKRLISRGQATGRADDSADIVTHRLAVYEEMTVPLLAYYRDREQLLTINGARGMDEVTWSIAVQLQRLRKRLAG
jgi:adenylate kinase